MTGREAGRVGVTSLVVTALVLALAVGAGWVAWSQGRLNTLVCGGPCGPEAVAAPEGMVAPAGTSSASPRPAARDALDPDAVRAAVAPLLERESLGGRVSAVVLDPREPATPLLESGSGALAPASTTKVLVAYAVLALADPGRRFETTVQRDGDRLVLVGGGDPYLAATPPRERTAVDRADLRTLARRTAAALERDDVREVTLGHDATLFTGPSASPAWEDDYVSGQVVTPVSALWADRGLSGGIRSAEPAAAAARRFAGLLEDAGVRVRGESTPVEAPGTEPVARVLGPTLEQAVEATLVRSDNEAAEVLLRHAAVAADEPATFEGGAAAVQRALADAEVPTDGLRLTDGSGLSRANRIAALTLARTLAAAAAEERTSGVLAGLPVGGLTGTLQRRYDDSGGAGVVRAKTGTLTGIHSLAGVVTDRRGVPMVFALMADDTEDVNAFVTQASLDDVASALAACRCG